MWESRKYFRLSHLISGPKRYISSGGFVAIQMGRGMVLSYYGSPFFLHMTVIVCRPSMNGGVQVKTH